MEDASVPQIKYGANVRIGNWYEEYCLEEDEITNFLRKRRKGQLLTQKTRTMFSNLLKELELSKMSPVIRYGDIVQFIAVGMKVTNEFRHVKPALSIVISEKTILSSQKIDESSEVSIAPSLKPCIRNSFIVTSPAGRKRDGEILTYGQDFIMESTQPGCPRLILYCSPKCANLTTVFEPTNVSMAGGGELNLPVGICPKISGEHFPKIPTGHTRWKCQNLNPDMRFESEGEPVPSNTRLVITHLATNQNLAAENVEFQTFFGNECLVSVHSYVDRLKRVDWQNIWCIKIGGEDDPIA